MPESITPPAPAGSVRVPANHRLAERELIRLVRSGEWEIDAEGRIWRLFVRCGMKTGGSVLRPCARRRAEKSIGPEGYLEVRAMRDWRRVCGLAHRLVWQHFFGDIPAGLTVNHKNGQKGDNRPGNLELATYSEQLKHAHRTGLIDQRGERNPAARLSNRKVALIRLEYASGGVTQEELARKHGVAFQTVSKIVRGEARASQPGPTSAEDHRFCASERDTATGRFVGRERQRRKGAA